MEEVENPYYGRKVGLSKRVKKEASKWVASSKSSKNSVTVVTSKYMSNTMHIHHPWQKTILFSLGDHASHSLTVLKKSLD